MTDLDKLIDAIEAGTLTDIGQEWRLAAMPREWWEPIVKSNSGSLDAAKALHEALLPGWEWFLGPSNAKIYPYNGSPLKSWCGMADNPARAWLLAILKAFRATQEGM